MPRITALALLAAIVTLTMADTASAFGHRRYQYQYQGPTCYSLPVYVPVPYADPCGQPAWLVGDQTPVIGGIVTVDASQGVQGGTQTAATEPTPAELANWQKMLDAKYVTPEQLVDYKKANAAERAKFYADFMKAQPTDAEIANWNEMLKEKYVTAAQLTEYKKVSTAERAKFYADFKKAQPTDAEMANWAEMVNAKYVTSEQLADFKKASTADRAKFYADFKKAKKDDK
ncbi:hypothetical protein [Fimbriiglobus ruber]|uniref:Uncharacterized protein n=1 Tax=Fimbriiglobus ruber TaxID=1908690 RepID=A0A225D3E2_9BACT|nr:hypothetical protein [Fimbriiglobus ruber]OWK36110.1 hypothetical protein FRUB_08673 [Fimbriiglobus ruber]